MSEERKTFYLLTETFDKSRRPQMRTERRLLSEDEMLCIEIMATREAGERLEILKAAHEKAVELLCKRAKELLGEDYDVEGLRIELERRLQERRTETR